MARISEIRGYEVLDSRGTPTVEAAVELETGHIGHFSVPSGASTGRYEALELRDGDPSRYRKRGVRRAVKHVEGEIRTSLKGEDASQQKRVDQILCDLDGTPNKSRLGANAILAVSVACAKASASVLNVSLPRYLGGEVSTTLPVPMFNVLNGGAHADSGLDVQEYMIAPLGAPSIAEAIRWGVEIYWTLRELLKADGQTISVGDEGGFAPKLGSNELALQFLEKAIVEAGYEPRTQVGVVLDVAATELYWGNMYHLESDGGKKEADAETMVELYDRWLQTYPIIAIEDGLAEDDWEGWAEMTRSLGAKTQLIGDDNFVTNIEKLSRGIQEGIANAIIIKPNQIGTLSETIDTVRMAQAHDYVPVMANRSAETTDPFIAELSVALAIPQIKTGAPCRGERTSKYNRLIRIEADLGEAATYSGAASFSRV